MLPKRLNGSLFNGKPAAVLCDQVTKSLHFLDPASGRSGIVGDSSMFELQPLLTSKELIKFIVLDSIVSLPLSILCCSIRVPGDVLFGRM